jgi:hypothetical protein
MDEQDGPQTHARTIAHVVLSFDGKEYAFDQDFGYGYPAASAHYMFTEGNYACDCNRSSFIREKSSTFPEMDCGEQIDLASISFSQQP